MNTREIKPGSVLMEPAAARWDAVVRERWGGWGRVRTGRSWELARSTRAALGLDPERPVIMSGHQPGFWHAGIVAKWFALGAAGATSGAQMVWVVVDHDAAVVERVRVPVMRDGGGVAARWWDVRTGELASGAGAAERNAACDRTAVMPKAPGERGTLASDGVRSGVERMAGALAARAGEPNAARQFALAAADALGEFGVRPVVVFATDLVRTPAWAEMIGAMRRDPAACRDAYNAAARVFPAARIAPLGDGELPLWKLGGAERARVHASDLGSSAKLAPRALLLTALLRMFVCDVFIHGTGGGASGGGEAEGAGYDRITERWIPAWLGEVAGGSPLSPSVVASATLALDLPGATVDPLVARARWTAHAARHNPGLLGDAGAAARKAEIVKALRSRRTSRGERRAAYLELHALLTDVRARHAARLAELGAAAARAGDAAEQLALREDRTWAFPLHGRERLVGLRDAVVGEFG